MVAIGYSLPAYSIIIIYCYKIFYAITIDKRLFELTSKSVILHGRHKNLFYFYNQWRSYIIQTKKYTFEFRDPKRNS